MTTAMQHLLQHILDLDPEGDAEDLRIQVAQARGYAQAVRDYENEETTKK